MQTTLAATALLMGLAGGPHCAAMCGAACAGIGLSGGSSAGAAHQTTGAAPIARSFWAFQIGRVAGYAALGALAAASVQGLGWLGTQSAALRPIWSLFHVAAALLGLVLLSQARQPVWLGDSARTVWQGVRKATRGLHRDAAPLVLGVLWSLLPCGLLYSALLVAALSSQPLQGAAVMALFALGSGLSLWAGPWFFQQLRQRLWRKPQPKLGGPHVILLQQEGQARMQPDDGDSKWAIRIAGAALFATSAWALWMGLVHDTAPWCVSP